MRWSSSPASEGSPKGFIAMKLAEFVSAGAKIPIVPVEFSSSLDVVNRSPLHAEEVPRLVKGERRARTKGITTARDEYSGNQRADAYGSVSPIGKTKNRAR